MSEFKLLDADSGVFFTRQLEHIKSKTYDVLYQDIMFRSLFPVNSDVNPGATTITYRTFDRVGKAQVLNGYASDLPRADVSGTETTIPVRTLGSSFAYSMKEIKSARMANFSLDQKRAEAARRAIEEKMEDVVWNGDADSNLPGLLSNTDIPADNVPNGAGAAPEWTTKTPDEILLDVNTACGTMFQTTLQKERPSRMLVPPAQWNYLFSTPRATGSDLSIGQWILANSPFIKEIMSVPQLTGAGAGSGDIFVIYNPDPMKLQVEIPEDIVFHPAQERNLEVIVPVTAEFAGLNVYYPLSLAIWEDI